MLGKLSALRVLIAAALIIGSVAIVITAQQLERKSSRQLAPRSSRLIERGDASSGNLGLDENSGLETAPPCALIGMAAEQKDRQQTIEVVKRNWQAEVETAQTYRDLAERERDEKRKGILLRMAEAEERHAHRWEAKAARTSAPSRLF